uniref:DH domain-containing protein n=1 Tax=Trichogramma kaykai TaxID=54128 RepID=A0ABD2XGK7_9HYME
MAGGGDVGDYNRWNYQNGYVNSPAWHMPYRVNQQVRNVMVHATPANLKNRFLPLADETDFDKHESKILTNGHHSNPPSSPIKSSDQKNSVSLYSKPLTNGSWNRSTTNSTTSSVERIVTGTSPEIPIKPVRNGSIVGASVEDIDVRKTKRWPTDKAYFIAKELLMTERTYKKDLEVINVYFREELSNRPEGENDCIVTLLENLADAHEPYLRDMEERVTRWESNAPHNIGDFLDNTLREMLPLYDEYIENLLTTIEKFEYFMRADREFEQLCRVFEAQKYCYLPLTNFLMKPLQRLFHYNSIIDRLADYYSNDHMDYDYCMSARDRLSDTLRRALDILSEAENKVQLCELQRDINGFDSLLQGDRRFIRQGCLQKYSRKGFQQRMFFLFSDVLLYTFRVPQQSTQCFKVHGQMVLTDMKIQENDNKTGADFAFVIHCLGNQSLTVAANSKKEKERWLDDLNQAILLNDSKESSSQYHSNLKTCVAGSNDEMNEQGGTSCDIDRHSSCGGAKASQRSNTAVHVCWHRNTSVSYSDQLRAFHNQLSGFLLRKFKNSNGWQKLWVVFTNFCLFFYKSHQDPFPLACLPLLGYAVSQPSEKDGINKDFVFKLQFKNHVYFFRAESDYTLGRWMEVVRSATQESHITSN